MSVSAQVFADFHDDGSADFTVSVDDEDHKFSASKAGGQSAEVAYEETLSWRGVIRVSEPPEHVFKALIASDEMTDYLERESLKSVRRIRH